MTWYICKGCDCKVAWVWDGVCYGCKHPESIVIAVIEPEKESNQ